MPRRPRTVGIRKLSTSPGAQQAVGGDAPNLSETIGGLQKQSLSDQISELGLGNRTGGGLFPGVTPEQSANFIETGKARESKRVHDHHIQVRDDFFAAGATGTNREQSLNQLDRAMHLSESFISEHNSGGEDGVPFQSGAAYATEQVQPFLDNYKRIWGRDGDRFLEMRGVAKDNSPSGFSGGVAERQEHRDDSAAQRDTMVQQSNQAQRQVKAINQAVFTGRKRRRGSSVSLPRVALAGLGNPR